MFGTKTDDGTNILSVQRGDYNSGKTLDLAVECKRTFKKPGEMYMRDLAPGS